MSPPPSTKNCFNSDCNDVLQRSRIGWKRRTGEFTELCDRCASAFAEGKFCETFHLKASGWRCCQSCGKKIHCGCIVSFHMFVLLDAGGIECLNCATSSFILTPNPAWPPPSIALPVLPEKSKDSKSASCTSSKSWSHRAGSGPIPWPQPSSVYSSSSAHTDLQPRTPFDVQRGFGRIFNSERLSGFSLEKKKLEESSLRLNNFSYKTVTPGTLQNDHSGDTLDEQATVCTDASHNLSLQKNDAVSQVGLSLSSVSMCEPIDQTEVIGNHARPGPPLTAKQFCGYNGSDLYSETQPTNGRPRGDPRQRNHLLSRYSPRITDEELQKISAESNSVVTPLFEKILSVSDAGKIGRLVLPKRCAEAYLPPISSPEGLPLQVQDSKGREWMLQFRFWPNNNSRMYVLEGVAPCIQSMHLQAGDTVTFSRIGPEGKLVMGFRKASSAPPSDQGSEPVNSSCGVPANQEIHTQKTKNGEVLSTPNQLKVSSLLSGFAPINQAKSLDQAGTLSKGDESGYAANEVLGAKSNNPSKKRNRTLGSRSKRVRVESKDQLELTLTCEQAQALLRPPQNFIPTIVIIEDIELEEYEDAPIIGRPTVFMTDDAGNGIQWIQCEDCHKWRKVPADALLPSIWTCSDNSWDVQRSMCSVAQEAAAQQLEDLLPTTSWAGSKKTKAVRQDSGSADILEGLAGLAKAIQEEGEALLSAAASSQAATTKHPRHKPGCTCIVCIQPPSGKGPKHKPTCTCNVCLTVRRRFKTLSLRREKKHAERVENAPQKTERHKDLADEDTQVHCNVGNSSPNVTNMSSEDLDNDLSRMGQIDLNIQPQKDGELSTGVHPGAMMRLLQDASNNLLSSKYNDSAQNELALVGGDGIGTGRANPPAPLPDSTR